MTTYNLYTRKRVLINTDPQKRCYNGAYYSYRYDWTPWELLVPDVREEEKERTLKYWMELNQIAVDARGPEAEKQFALMPLGRQPDNHDGIK